MGYLCAMVDRKGYEELRPYGGVGKSKKGEVSEMFDRISGSYDFLNHFLSLGIDRYWRKAVVDVLRDMKPGRILDVATGTGDLAIQMYRSLKPKVLYGVDISEKMLEIGRKKLRNRGLEGIHLAFGDSESLEFDGGSFDAVTAAFGVRNFQNPELGLEEMYRVLRSGGRVVILEFSKPRSRFFGSVYNWYFRYVLPRIGRLLSKDKRAYSYLHESVRAFPDYEEFVEMLEVAGFKRCKYRSLTFGICCLYTGEK